MVAAKTNEKINDANKAKNNAHIYISRKDDARSVGIDWKHYSEIPWKRYNIKETDLRVKTVTFTTPQPMDLTTGVFCVLIKTGMHEDFGGEIIDFDYDNKTGIYEYQCQDFSRDYMNTIDVIMTGKTTIYRLIQNLLTKGGIPFSGKVSKKLLKEYKHALSGLLPSYQYDLKWKRSNWKGKGSNFMEQKPQLIIRNKTTIEAIRDICYSGNNEVDCYVDKYGVVQIQPIMPDEWANKGLVLTTPEVASAKYKFDLTNIITGVTVHSMDKSKIGKYWGSNLLLNLDLSVFFGTLGVSMDNPNASSASSSSSSGKGKDKDKKKSTDATKQGNPYNTKKKKVEVSMDKSGPSSSDKKYIATVCNELKKNGWDVTNNGVGPNRHSESHFKVKNGVHFCIFNGVDAGVLREMTMNSSYHKREKNHNSRTVCGWMIGHASDIRKGGKKEHYMERAHDDHYSPTGFKGLKEPRKKLIKYKIPFMYANNAKEMASKFMTGGDEPEAL